MKKRPAIILLAGLLILGGVCAAWMINSRNVQREWPHKQLQNAVTLGAALSEHRDQHGSYPARLEDLVNGGTMDQEEFAELRFQAGPKADPEQWLYSAPKQLSDIAIVAPTEIFPWSGHSGYTVTARADGGGELILGTKQSRIPAWASK